MINVHKIYQHIKKLPQGLLYGIVVINFSGQPEVELKEGNVRPQLKENFEIKGDMVVSTKANEFAILKINNLYSIAVLPGSSVVFEGVKEKTYYEVRTVRMLRGQSHIEYVGGPSKPKNYFKGSDEKDKLETFEPMRIESDFFSFLTQEDQKLSLYINLNLKTALLSVCNLGEEFKLNLFNHEVSPILKPNEGIKFQGVLDDSGKVAYDLLLEKRKAPQGKWMEKETCRNTMVKDIQTQAEKNQLSEKRKNEKKQAAVRAQKKRDDAKYLCHKPYGQLNQCRYILKQNKCFRERCNAEGKWAGSEEVSRDKYTCTPAGQVQDC